MPWYYVRDKVTEGPTSESELGVLFRQGVINESTFVWNNKKAHEWTQLQKVEGLIDRIRDDDTLSRRSSKRGSKRVVEKKKTKYNVGDVLFVKLGGKNTEKAKVIKVKDDEIKIHYILYSNSDDEWIKMDDDRITDRKHSRRHSNSRSTSGSRTLNKTRSIDSSGSKRRKHNRALSTNAYGRADRRQLALDDDDDFGAYSTKKRRSFGSMSRKSDRDVLESERIRFAAEQDAFDKIKQDFFSNRFTLDHLSLKPGESINKELILENKTLRILNDQLVKQRDDEGMKYSEREEALNSKKRDLDGEKKQLEEAREALEKERSTLRRKLQDLQQVAVDRKMLRNLKREIKANREKLEAQNNSIALQEGDTRGRMIELETKLANLQKERETLEQQQAALEAEKELLMRSRDQFNHERQTLMKAHEIFKKERRELDDEKERLREEITRLKRREEQKQQEMETKLLALDKEKAQVLLEKEKMTNIVKEQINQMTNEFNMAREKQEEDARLMEQEKVQFEEEIKRLIQENRVLQVEKAGVQQQLNTMSHQVKNASADDSRMDKISERVLELTAQCTELQVQNATLTQELASLKGEMEGKTRDLEMSRNLLDMKTQREDLARQQISELQNTVTTLQVRKDLLESNHERCLRDLEKEKRDYESLKSKHDVVKEEKMRLEHRVETLEHSLENLHDQMDDFVPPPLPFDPASPQASSSSNPNTETDANGANLQKDFDNLMNQILNDRAKFKEEEDDMNRSMTNLFAFGNDETDNVK